MPSRCPSIDEVVRDVDGELSVNRHEELAAHYLGCAACRTRRAELDAMVARFAVGADEVDPELTRDVMAAIRARRSGAAAGAADDGEGASAGTAAGTSAARGQR
ncbi:MAG: zf-HC2 domain-containing protein, partial [Myxococcales bacterium]|nr:zf-HC2 domain-containing protein [Myxococcales bacterium]